MYSKFFQHSDINSLETQLDTFLKELDEVTGNIVTLKMFQQNDTIVLLVIYSCWKKI